MDEFLNWYLAPWRKIGRGPFNTIVFAVAIPGMLLWFVGFGESASGVGGMIGNLMDMGAGGVGGMQNAANGGGDLTHMVNTVLGPMASDAPLPASPAIPWGAIGGWVDSLLWLLCLPLVRMRVRDMGYANDTVGHWLWVAAAFAGTLPDLFTKLGVPGFESLSTWGSVIAFVGLLVLCIKGHAQPPRDEHFIYTPPAGKAPGSGDFPR